MRSWITAQIRAFRKRKLSQPEKTLNIVDKAIKEIENGGYKNAIKKITKAIDSSPDSFKLYHHRGDAYTLNGQHHEAITDFDTAIRLNPGYPDTYLDRGNEWYELGQLDKALKDFSEAIRLKPEWGEAHANRAVIHAELGNLKESETDAEKAKTLGVTPERLEEMLNTVLSPWNGES
ncbi:MAG: tetratricopeptide repeat protein [Chloroflexota bacterium]